MANTIKEKELRNDWDALTASDSTKAVGHKQTLRPEEDDLTTYRDRAGID